MAAINRPIEQKVVVIDTWDLHGAESQIQRKVDELNLEGWKLEKIYYTEVNESRSIRSVHYLTFMKAQQ